MDNHSFHLATQNSLRMLYVYEFNNNNYHVIDYIVVANIVIIMMLSYETHFKFTQTLYST